jgi:GNAT superfamily N-acetyltransferase
MIKFPANYIQRGLKFLFWINYGPCHFFRLKPGQWSSRPQLLLIKDVITEPVTEDLVERYFHSDPTHKKMLLMYLSLDAKGLLMHNNREWIGYTWYVPLSCKERNFWGKERHYTFIGLPKNFTPGPDDIWGFSLEVHPRYEGKGASAYLIGKCYDRITEEYPNSTIYSNVLLTNETSAKIKKKLGEENLGSYALISFRLLGRYFSNVYRGALANGERMASETGHKEFNPQSTTSTTV